MLNPKVHHGGNISSEDIIACSYLNEVVKVDRLARGGIDINSTEESTNYTPLHIAVVEGHTELFDYLLGRDDVDLWAEDRWGRSPGAIAIENGDLNSFAERIARRAESGNPQGEHPSP